MCDHARYTHITMGVTFLNEVSQFNLGHPTSGGDHFEQCEEQPALPT